ncbi:cubilin-like [Lethenteron reissneri]|uniref:cubilin-like n=1 Tax=Lethenteron reissneri TaxID=7753 RepID=UPI002AB674C0|nr:cubilin-like [Lethenteron reissneri]
MKLLSGVLLLYLFTAGGECIWLEPGSEFYSADSCRYSFRGSGSRIYLSQNCLHTFVVEDDEVVSLYMSNSYSYCEGNDTMVVVYDGANDQAPILGTYSCRSTTNFISTNSSLSLYYKHLSSSYSYISVSFFASPASSGCGGRLSANQIVTSPNYPNNYSNNASCTWEAYAPPGYKIQLYINDFQVLDQPGNTRSSSRRCKYDGLTVMDESEGDSSLLVRLCGYLPRQSFQSTGNLSLQFSSDGIGTGRGFYISLSYFADSPNAICGGILESSHGNLSYSGYNAQSCIWIIKVPEGSTVQINVSMSSQSYSNLVVYDGESELQSIIAQKYYWGQQTSSFIASTGNSMLISFYGIYISADYNAVVKDDSFDCDFNGNFCGWTPSSGDVINWDLYNTNYYNPSSDGGPFAAIRTSYLPDDVPEMSSYLLGPQIIPSNSTRCLHFKYMAGNSLNLRLLDVSAIGSAVGDSENPIPVLWEPTMFDILDHYGQQWQDVAISITANVTQVAFQAHSYNRGALIGIDKVHISENACLSSPAELCVFALEGANGTIKYELAPQNSDASCFWEITAPLGKIIKLKLNTEGNNNAYCFSIYEIKYNIVKQITTNYRANEQYTYYSSHNTLTVKVPNRCVGNLIIGNFTAISPNDVPGCGGVLKGPSYDYVYSPNYPNDYSYNSHCEWSFDLHGDSKIAMSGYLYGMQNSINCTADSLEISDVINGSRTSISKFCQSWSPETIVSRESKIVFTSDWQNEGMYGYFYFLYRVFAPCSGNLTGWQGSIVSPNATDYDFRCSWNINTPAGTIIKLSFEELNMYYYSTFDIYDGESLDAPYLGRFSGSIVPPPILSTGNSLYIRFYNPSYTQPPFKITYEAMEVYTSVLENNAERISSFDVTSQRQNILLFLWELRVPEGFNVKIDFSDLQLEDDPLCWNESLTVYDGERSLNTSLGIFCGSSIPLSVRSNSDSLHLLLRLRTNEPWKRFTFTYFSVPKIVPTVKKECGRVPTGGKSRVVGGSLANVGKWPWQASLQFYNSHMCGASLISKDWLVSAAHCFEGRNDVNAWQVRLGTTYIYDSWSSVNLAVAEIITHERFNYTAIDYDIALVRLSRSVDFTSQISPICLPPDTSHFPLPGKTCYISGWGRTSEADYGVYYSLLDAPMDVFSHSGCSSDKMNGKSITTRMICIGHPAGGISACQGDSGGPLTCQGTDGTWYLSGVTSWGNGCARPMKPAVYTKTSKLLKWIKQYTGL